MNKFLFSLLLLAVAFTSCKKDKVKDDASASDLLKDSIYAYAKEEYLWFDALPDASVFNPRSYTGNTEVAALQAEIDALSQIKINPSTGKAYEYDTSYPGTSKYSYIDEGQAATSIGGTAGDMGFSVFYNAYNDLRIKYVYPNSPAKTAGLVRGYKVTAINNSSNIYYDPNSSNPNADPNLLYVVNALGGNSITLTLQKPDNSTMMVTVNKGTYAINPVIKYSVITTATGKKVGYFAFSRFTLLKNDKGEDVSQNVIDQALNSLAASNITELVVDLRYNGGGSVETSEYIANYLAPASKTGSTMFTEYYNSNLQADKYPLLAKKYSIPAGFFNVANNTSKFSKKGSLNLNRVFFLVTGSTASASELLINNLKPALPGGVQIIGATTYGKPVGFFGIPVGRYDLYLAEFESRNAEGKADFYQGMVPGGNFPGVAVRDDVTKDFGDPTEGLLARALNYVEKGTFSMPEYKTQGLSTTSATALQGVNQLLENTTHEFKGAVHDREFKRIQ